MLQVNMLTEREKKQRSGTKMMALNDSLNAKRSHLSNLICGTNTIPCRGCLNHDK